MEATDYASAREMAKSRRRKLANNTYLEINEDSFGVRLHNTQIVKWYADGTTRLDTGGWFTVTTKDRMNKAIRPDWSVYSERGIWSVINKKGSYIYADEMILHSDGTVDREGTDPKITRKLREDVKKFSDDFIEALFDKKVPAPGRGDCWFCLMELHHWRDTDHLISHMDEKYYVPSLLAKAIERFPVSRHAMELLKNFWFDPAPSSVEVRARPFGGIGADQLAKSLRRFMYEKLGTSS